MTSYNRQKVAVAVLLTIAAVASSFGQSSQDFRARFREVVSYEIRPGVLMTPKYAQDGQVCEMALEKRQKTETGITFGPSFSEEEVKTLVNQLVPEKQRGKGQTEFLNSFINGGFITTEYRYENILVSVHGVTRPQAEDTVVIITWRKRVCGQHEL